MYQFIHFGLDHLPQSLCFNQNTALVNNESFPFAVMTRSGDLVYTNRAFVHEFSRAALRGYLHWPDRKSGSWPEVLNAHTGDYSEGLRIVPLTLKDSKDIFGYLLLASLDRAPSDLHGISPFDIISSAYEQKFNQHLQGLYLADASANTLKVNSAYEKLACLPQEELIGRNLKELEDQKYFSQSVTLAVLSASQKKCIKQISFVQKIITGREVLVTGVPIGNNPQNITHVLTYVREILPLSTLLQLLERAERKILTPGDAHAGPQSQPPDLPVFPSLPLIARDPASLRTLHMTSTAARSNAPVLLTGETGVGKDLYAQYIHLMHQSGRRQIPFVVLNCAAVPSDLLESELFGFTEGAFSGARQGGKKGLVEEANGGILFLNEIGEMPLSMQAKLLTFLDQGYFRPLGGTRTRQVYTRILAASNIDLHQAVMQGHFRSDLYYRLNVFRVHIPALRERVEDIQALTIFFLRRFAKKHEVYRYLSPTVHDILQNYRWPGNVRELKNVIERIVVFSSSEQISISDIPPEILNQDQKPEQCGFEIEAYSGRGLKEAVRTFEADLIERTVQKHGTLSKAAHALKVDPTTLSRKIARNQ